MNGFNNSFRDVLKKTEVTQGADDGGRDLIDSNSKGSEAYRADSVSGALLYSQDWPPSKEVNGDTSFYRSEHQKTSMQIQNLSLSIVDGLSLQLEDTLSKRRLKIEGVYEQRAHIWNSAFLPLNYVVNYVGQISGLNVTADVLISNFCRCRSQQSACQRRQCEPSCQTRRQQTVREQWDCEGLGMTPGMRRTMELGFELARPFCSASNLSAWSPRQWCAAFASPGLFGSIAMPLSPSAFKIMIVWPRSSWIESKTPAIPLEGINYK